MTLKTILLGAASAVVLSAGAANAAPATAETSLNVRSGPGTQYAVVGAIPAGATVDVGGCTGSWCRVSFSGGSGFANRSYLAMGEGGAGGAAVAVAPGYVYEDAPYADDYYDYGYAYGPSVGFGFYANPGYRYRHGWHGGGGRNWQGGGNWAGRPGAGWAGRPGGPGMAPGGMTPRQGFVGGGPRGATSIGAGANIGGRGMAGAPAGMRGGAMGGGMRGGAMGGGGMRGGGGQGGGPRH